MINTKYKRVYDEFINNYENIHINPWHEISKEELNNIYNKLINELDINDDYSFNYFINYIIKRLSGLSDTHTFYWSRDFIPYTFKIIDDKVLVNYPDSLKGYYLESINGIDIKNIIKEIDNIITYGTNGKKVFEIEKSLFNRMIMFGLPIFSNNNELIYELVDNNGYRKNIIINKEEKYDNLFDYDTYLYGNNTEYKIIDNCLIYNHSSVQNKYKELIEQKIEELKHINLDNINTIIIDLRGNIGGNSSLNNYLIDFLKEHLDKKIICLTDYRIFSGGRYALRDLINLGAITIGDEIGTPINCYGNNTWCNIDNYYFGISEHYYNPMYLKDDSGKYLSICACNKEEYKNNISEEILKPIIFKPDIYVNQTIEDYLNNIDTVLKYAIEYSKFKER